MSTISMKLFMEAIKYYTELGYKLIDVPQCVDFDVSQHTKPKGIAEQFHAGMKVYVASAEQSFIQLHKEGNIKKGKYLAVTPCYRTEAVLDEIHYSMFLKAELIVIGKEESYTVMTDALRFFNEYVSVTYTPTDESEDSFDIIHNWTNTELGSYGVRKMLDGTPYTYGTALADPRLSYCIENNSKEAGEELLKMLFSTKALKE